MVCNAGSSNVMVRVGNLSDSKSTGEGNFEGLRQKLDSRLGVSCPPKTPEILKMMVESGAVAEAGAAANVLPEKDQVQHRDYASGGWKSKDGKLSCGYSSFRGKRVTMEDFYDVKSSKIDEQTINLFGVFDGHGGSHAAEYLKEHLFENLMKHPQFMTDTKLAISETYQKTDSDFLDSERNTLRDDGSTASTAVLIGNHLYVANVGDSRTIVSKAGKGAFSHG